MNRQQNNQSEIVLYTTTDGTVKIDTVFRDETIWLTQKKMAELFDVGRPAITKHLKNIFESGELDEKVVGSILEHTTQHGAIEGKTQTKPVKFYNLDAIIAVGYRVNSKRQTVTMAQWAEKLDAFLEFNEQEILTHAGKVKAEIAKKIAKDRYEEFDSKRKKAEALAADEEDLKQLEEIVKRIENGKWKSESGGKKR